jgi:hypothetical protein
MAVVSSIADAIQLLKKVKPHAVDPQGPLVDSNRVLQETLLGSPEEAKKQFLTRNPGQADLAEQVNWNDPEDVASKLNLFASEVSEEYADALARTVKASLDSGLISSDEALDTLSKGAQELASTYGGTANSFPPISNLLDELIPSNPPDAPVVKLNNTITGNQEAVRVINEFIPEQSRRRAQQIGLDTDTVFFHAAQPRSRILNEEGVVPFGEAPEDLESLSGIDKSNRDRGTVFFSENVKFVNNWVSGSQGSIVPVYVNPSKLWDFRKPEHIEMILEDPAVAIEADNLRGRFAKGDWTAIERPEVQDAIQGQGFQGFYVKESVTDDFVNVGLYDEGEGQTGVANAARSIFAGFSSSESEIAKKGISAALLAGVGVAATQEAEAAEPDSESEYNPRFGNGIFSDDPNPVAQAVLDAGTAISEEFKEGALYKAGAYIGRHARELYEREGMQPRRFPVTPAEDFPEPPVEEVQDGFPEPAAVAPAGAPSEVTNTMTGMVGLGALMNNVDPTQIAADFERQMQADDEVWRQQGRDLVRDHYEQVIGLLSAGRDAPLTEDALREAQQWLESPMGHQYGYVLEAFPTAPPETKKALTAQLYIREQYFNYMDGITVPEIIGDVAFSMVPFTEITDMIQSDLDADFIDQFNTLPPADRAAVFTEVLKHLDETYEGRRVAVGAILEQTFGLSGQEDFTRDRALEAVFAGIDTAAILVPILKVATSTSPLRAAIKAGEVRMAAELAARALQNQDGTLLRYLGVTREDAVQMASPFESDIVEGLEHMGKDLQFSDLAAAGLAPQNREGVAALRGQFFEILDEENLMRPQVYSSQELSANQMSAVNDVERTLQNELRGSAEKVGALRYLGEDAAGSGQYRVSYDILGPVGEARTGPLEEWEYEGMVRAMDIPAAQKRELLEVMEDGGPLKKTLVDFAGGKRRAVEDMITAYRDSLRDRGIVRVETRNYSAGLDNLGMIEMKDTKAGFSSVLSPIEYIERQVVLDAEILRSTEAKLQGQLDRIVQTAMSPLDSVRRKGRASKNVEAALDAWADQGKVPTRRELAEGIETDAGTLRLETKAEQDAFYNVRDVFDMYYILGNKIDTERLKITGASFLDVNDGMYGFVRQAGGVETTLRSMGSEKVWDVEEARFLTKAEVRTRVADGEHDLVSLVHAMPHQKGISNVVMVPRQAVKEVREWNGFNGVRPRISGYVPKINMGVRGVVRAYQPAMVNGVRKSAEESGVTRVERFIRNPTEGHRVQKELQDAAEDGVIYKYEEDMTDPLTGRLNEFNQTGLFRGRRSRDEIRTGADVHITKRRPAFQALMRNLQHISNQYPMHEWKVAQQQRFINTVNKKDGWNIQSFDAPLDGHPNQPNLERLRDYLKQQFKFPTQEERAWEKFILSVSRMIDDGSGFGEAASRTVMNLKDVNPLGALRGAAFHAFLGFFNPAQLYVQAQAGTIALSLYPKLGTQGAARASALWALRYVDNAETAAITAKRLGLNVEDFQAMHRAWRSSGLAESVKNNADFTAMLNGYTLGTAAARRFLDSGLMFYRAGEQAARTFAWEIATAERARDLKKAIKDFTNDDWVQVFRKTQDYTLNMSSANRAGFQTNVLTSVGTQFWQVQTKFLEALVLNGRQFTPEMKRRLLVGQIAIYGAAAVPLGEQLANYAGQVAAGLLGYEGTPEDVPEWMVTLVRQGILTGTLSEITSDGRLQLAERGAIGFGLEETVGNLIEQNLLETFLGAGGGLFDRAQYATQLLIPLAGQVGLEDVNQGALALQAVEYVASITSTGNNAANAIRMAQTGLLYSRSGTLLLRDPTLSEIIGKGVGLELTRTQNLYTAMQDQKARQEALRKDAEIAWRYYADYTRYSDQLGDEYDPALADKALAGWALVNAANENRQQELRTMVWNKITQPQSKEEQLFSELYWDKLSTDNLINDVQMFSRMNEEE